MESHSVAANQAKRIEHFKSQLKAAIVVCYDLKSRLRFCVLSLAVNCATHFKAISMVNRKRQQDGADAGRLS